MDGPDGLLGLIPADDKVRGDLGRTCGYDLDIDVR